jgi:hypothetical protein
LTLALCLADSGRPDPRGRLHTASAPKRGLAAFAPFGADAGDSAVGFPVADGWAGGAGVLAPAFETAGALGDVRVCGVVRAGCGFVRWGCGVALGLGLGLVVATPVEDVVGAVEMVVSPAPAAT